MGRETRLSPTARPWQTRMAEKLIPGYTDPGLAYDRLLQDGYRAAPVWVDAGCGRNQDIMMAGDYTGLALGFDLGDRRIPRYLRADVYRQPFGPSSVGFISCRWVFEHLREPEAALEEFKRVLGPGSRLLIRTTNRRHYTSWLSRILPMSVKERLIKTELFPTYYLFNDDRAVGRFLTGDPGWELLGIEYIENLHYANPAAFVLSVIYEMVLNGLGLGHLKSTIILELAKKDRG